MGLLAQGGLHALEQMVAGEMRMTIYLVFFADGTYLQIDAHCITDAIERAPNLESDIIACVVKDKAWKIREKL
jgi:hypothetical protein